MDGERLSAEKVKEISKWPNRVGQISILLGQILSPGGKLLSQINGPGGKLLSQIEKKSEGEEAAAGRREPAAPDVSLANCQFAICKSQICNSQSRRKDPFPWPTLTSTSLAIRSPT